MRLRSLRRQASTAGHRARPKSDLFAPVSPPRECAFRLIDLLDVNDGPWWYRYDDGSWNPVDGELYYDGSDYSGDSDHEPDWNFDNESDSEDEDGEDVPGADEDGENVQVKYEDGEGDATISGNEGREEDVPSSSDEDCPEEMLDDPVVAAQPVQQELRMKTENCSV